MEHVRNTSKVVFRNRKYKWENSVIWTKHAKEKWWKIVVLRNNVENILHQFHDLMRHFWFQKNI